MTKLSKEEVFDAIKQERNLQDIKWGTLDERQQSLAGLLHVAQAELNEAVLGWLKNIPGKHSALSEVVQVAAVCVAILEQFGTEGNPK